MTEANIIRSRQLLEVMRTRSLSKGEWDELVDIASEDPFLLDALEGLKDLSPIQQAGVMENIHKKLNARSAKVSSTSIGIRNTYKWAAAVLILISLGVIIVLWRDSGDPIAEVTEPPLVQEEERENYKPQLEVAPAATSDERESLRRHQQNVEESNLQGPKDFNDGDPLTPMSATDQMDDARTSVEIERDMGSKNLGKRTQAYALAAPKIGWKAYYAYIRENIKVPDEAVAKSIEGEVWLEFDLDSTGRAGDIRVTSSLCSSCDTEAKRLLREGPEWDVENAQVPIGRLVIEF